MLDNLQGSKYAYIWIDLETNLNPGCGWSQDYDSNCKFTIQLAEAAMTFSGKKVGIYASNYMWNQIMGGPQKCQKFSSLSLWYAHYDMKPSFDDFQSFGSWNKPLIKQYKGTTAICGASVDYNYR